MRRITGALRGGLTLLLFSLNTVFWTFPLLGAHVLKLLRAAPGWRRFWSRVQNGIGTSWISFNNLTLEALNPVRWDVEGADGLSSDAWYVVVANHRSWVDILVLQKVFNRRIPFLKFFLKKELIWVPFLGLAWWSLDYPFLDRSSRTGKDLESIRRAVGKFGLLPVSVMNFVEGTRFQKEKRESQRSPYRYLLKPRGGGLAFLLGEMGPQVTALLDVTIVYPVESPTLWDFFCGRLPGIQVRIRELPMEQVPRGDYTGDRSFRRAFGEWLNGVWTRKDEEISALLGNDQI